MHMALMSSGEKYLVADFNLADFGRREIAMAEHEMPGLMELRARYLSEQPLSGVRVTGSLHMTIQTAVLIETLCPHSGHKSDGQAATFFPHIMLLLQ